MSIDPINGMTPPQPVIEAPLPHSRDAEYAMLEMISRAQDSVGLLQQQADEQNVMVQTQQELAIYQEAQKVLQNDADAVKNAPDDAARQVASTEYQKDQTLWQTTESQWQGYVQGATANGSQDSQNMTQIAALGNSATTIWSTAQQLENGF